MFAEGDRKLTSPASIALELFHCKTFSVRVYGFQNLEHALILVVSHIETSSPNSGLGTPHFGKGYPLTKG